MLSVSAVPNGFIPDMSVPDRMGGDERISLRRGSEEDLDVLTAFSQQRIFEQHQYTDVDNLRAKMLEMIRSDFVAFLFMARGKIIGYSLVSRKIDPLSIIEYFLVPEERGKGYGYEAVAKLLDATNSTSIDVSANAWREAAGAM
jgi:RimJ/RimL family protein N-acetyltransferase